MRTRSHCRTVDVERFGNLIIRQARTIHALVRLQENPCVRQRPSCRLPFRQQILQVRPLLARQLHTVTFIRPHFYPLGNPALTLYLKTA
jgi:hypothetical protein